MKPKRSILVCVLVLCSVAQAFAQTDQLPSWNEGANKRAIADFVNRVTKEGGPDFVPVSQRIATFVSLRRLAPNAPVSMSKSRRLK